MDRITWTDKGYATLEGSVNKLALFTINMSTIRSGPQYFLDAKIPFRSVDIEMAGDDDEALKESAERLLVAYVAALGAAFPNA
ncbi:hypothetical protein ETD86_34730 [Nonomuraea turkmeniaca]|uniref:Uncharacterized protein n=1 Tax=Nonomuraea turkmeniaca TaxID=103838 RepID=A0A5S4F6R7_9ACTN|nr:hypothetical protein [Nonomuraea turkmeniaca]TMR11727.1 hypothetical protein ETD86_34730 [Nonomuraea turkmeniaca]